HDCVEVDQVECRIIPGNPDAVEPARRRDLDQITQHGTQREIHAVRAHVVADRADDLVARNMQGAGGKQLVRARRQRGGEDQGEGQKELSHRIVLVPPISIEASTGVPPTPEMVMVNGWPAVMAVEVQVVVPPVALTVIALQPVTATPLTLTAR